MTDGRIEFIVKGWETGESGSLKVIGRVGDVPIHLNDTFDTLCRIKRRRFPEESGDEPVVECTRPVSLRVTCIQAYDRPLNVLSQGMTGSLALEGSGSEFVAPGWILCRGPSC